MTRIKFNIYKIILLLALGVLLCAEAYSGYRVHEFSSERKNIKQYYSLLNNITFGLFSIDQWREKISAILNGQVQDYHMTAQQKKDMQKAVEKELHGLISKTVADINKPQKSLGGKLKKMAFNTIVDSGALQAQVRPFAKTIIAKVSSPESQDRLKNIAASKVHQLENQTYDSTYEASSSVTNYLYKKYKVASADQFDKEIDSRLAANQKQAYQFMYIMLACVILALGLWWLMRKQVDLQPALFVFSLLFALVLLLVGAASSVIEVDARIKELNLTLMGSDLKFENQVLFFQSKSILGIVQTLIDQTKPDAVMVGILIFLFVVILPLIRLFAKGVHIISSTGFANNRIVKFLAFESGKWDMADVMIVGMLMTYIGLNGILKSQLSNLNIHSGALNTETVNGTSLQPGYFIFAAYALFAILLAYILKRITPHKVD